MLHRPRSLVRHSDAPRSEDIIKEREALQELVQTAGWRMFVAKATREYQGAGYHQKMGTALTDNNDNLKARVVHQTALEMMRLMQWPSDRLRELTGDKE